MNAYLINNLALYILVQTCQRCKQCKILNFYEKELISLKNLHIVNQYCEKNLVVEKSNRERSAEELLLALRSAVHNDSEKLAKFTVILLYSENVNLGELIWNDYCKL